MTKKNTFINKVSVRRDEVEDSNAEEFRVFNNKVKQKNKKLPRRGKTSKQAGRQKTGAQSNM